MLRPSPLPASGAMCLSEPVLEGYYSTRGESGIRGVLSGDPSLLDRGLSLVIGIYGPSLWRFERRTPLTNLLVHLRGPSIRLSHTSTSRP